MNQMPHFAWADSAACLSSNWAWGVQRIGMWWKASASFSLHTALFHPHILIYTSRLLPFFVTGTPALSLKLAPGLLLVSGGRTHAASCTLIWWFTRSAQVLKQLCWRTATFRPPAGEMKPLLQMSCGALARLHVLTSSSTRCPLCLTCKDTFMGNSQAIEGELYECSHMQHIPLWAKVGILT